MRVSVVQEQLLHDLQRAQLASRVQWCAMQVRNEVDLRLATHEKQFDEAWLGTADCQMQRAHLCIVRQLIRVGVSLKQEELDNLHGCILDCQMQEALTHHVKAVKHLPTAALRLGLKHFVHLDKLLRLVVLDEL